MLSPSLYPFGEYLITYKVKYQNSFSGVMFKPGVQGFSESPQYTSDFLIVFIKYFCNFLRVHGTPKNLTPPSRDCRVHGIVMG